MAEIVLFHHIQGLTPGVVAFADELRAAGHIVHTPDLYGGRTFDSIEEGAGYAQGEEALVYAGLSFGVMQAQRLAQTRPGAAGALLVESALPITGDWAIGPWPDGV